MVFGMGFTTWSIWIFVKMGHTPQNYQDSKFDAGHILSTSPISGSFSEKTRRHHFLDQLSFTGPFFILGFSAFSPSLLLRLLQLVGLPSFFQTILSNCFCHWPVSSVPLVSGTLPPTCPTALQPEALPHYFRLRSMRTWSNYKKYIYNLIEVY